MKTLTPEPILQFTDSQHCDGDLENIPKNYSFGSKVYEDFIERRGKVKEVLSLDDTIEFHMAGTIKNNVEKKRYVLETAIGFNSELSSNLLIIINFLNDMTENTQRIFNDEKYQANFKKAVLLLKKNKIGLEKAFKLKDEFQKKYEFWEYLFYDSKDTVIKHYVWEDNTRDCYEKVTVPKKEDIPISSLCSTLLMLNEKGLIEFDYDCITKLKERYRKKFFSFAEKKSIAFYKRLVEEEQKIERPLFSITKKTSFRDVTEILHENELLDYFPFSSRCDAEFLAYILREHFKKEE